MASVLEILSYVGWVLLAIMILVFIHELGHFLFAKLFKMRVERFSVGFPPKILGFKKGETEYVLGATPLGGYVKIVGMVDESMDTDLLMESEPQPWEFRAKPVWQRIVVIVAGVTFNMILAAVIFMSLKLALGDSYIPAEKVDGIHITEGSFFHDIGLRTGDRIVAVSGRPVERYEDLMDVEGLLADTMTITVERNGAQETFVGPEDIMTQLNRTKGDLGISVWPSLIGGVQSGAPAGVAGMLPGDRIVAIDSVEISFWEEMTAVIRASDGSPMLVRWGRPDSLVDPNVPLEPIGRRGDLVLFQTELIPEVSGDSYILGVQSASATQLEQEFGVRYVKYGFGEAIVAGIGETFSRTSLIVKSLGRLFTGRENVRENLGGPIAIAQITKQAADQGWANFWNIVAMLSITLAIVNILPIPALDGGHLVFLLYEGITRREPSVKFRMVTQQIGMLILLVFMAFLIFNDILRL